MRLCQPLILPWVEWCLDDTWTLWSSHPQCAKNGQWVEPKWRGWTSRPVLTYPTLSRTMTPAPSCWCLFVKYHLCLTCRAFKDGSLASLDENSVILSRILRSRYPTMPTRKRFSRLGQLRYFLRAIGLEFISVLLRPWNLSEPPKAAVRYSRWIAFSRYTIYIIPYIVFSFLIYLNLSAVYLGPSLTVTVLDTAILAFF